MSLQDEYLRVCSTPSDIHLDLPHLVRLAEETDAHHVIELGTRTGVSTIAWLYALEGRGWLTSVDIDPKPDIGDYDHWTFIQGDDLEVVKRLEPAEIVFIDTSHHYAHTLAELDAYGPLATKRIVLHDTHLRRPGGSPPRPIFPVRTAIIEFCAEHALSWVELDPEGHGYGLGVINTEG